MNKERTVQEDEELRKICEDYLRFGEMGDEGVLLKEVLEIINILRLYEAGYSLSEAKLLVESLDTQKKMKEWNKSNKEVVSLKTLNDFKLVVDREVEKLINLGFYTERKFSFSSYKDKSGKIVPTYIVFKEGIITLLLKESAVVRHIITRFLSMVQDKHLEIIKDYMAKDSEFFSILEVRKIYDLPMEGEELWSELCLASADLKIFPRKEKGFFNGRETTYNRYHKSVWKKVFGIEL